MSPKTCSVTFRGVDGIQHSVDVTAESVYEAAALGVSLLRQDGWTDVIGPGMSIDVRATHPATTHSVTLAQIRRWCDGVAVSPDEVLKRRKVKQLLEG